MKKNKYIIIGVVAVILLVALWFAGSEQRPTQDSDSPLVSSNGLHYHPQLSIYIDGEKVDIPANIGLIGGHRPMHTHDPDGVIHLEFSGRVYESDTTLGKFFEIWNKDFSQTKLLDAEGEVTMTVNGEVNTEYGDYLMRDGDKIELRIGGSEGN